MAIEDQLMTKTGLSFSTVNELLRKGWSYVEETGKVARWEHPEAKMPRREVYKKPGTWPEDLSRFAGKEIG